MVLDSIEIVQHRSRPRSEVQWRRVVRHENCYSRAGAGTGAHKLRIRCFTCHIPASHHLRVHGSCHVHANESRPGPDWSVSDRTRESRTPTDRIFSSATITLYLRYAISHTNEKKIVEWDFSVNSFDFGNARNGLLCHFARTIEVFYFWTVN